MSFGKSFIISLSSLISFDFIIFVIAYSLGNNLDSFFSTLADISYLAYNFLAPIARALWVNMEQVIAYSNP